MEDRPLEFHPEAEEEYLGALAWYRERSLPAGVKFEEAFRQAVQRIKDSPERAGPFTSLAFANTRSASFLSSSCTKATLPVHICWRSRMAADGRGIGRDACDAGCRMAVRKAHLSRRTREMTGTPLMKTPRESPASGRDDRKLAEAFQSPPRGPGLPDKKRREARPAAI
jgi:hypothetical protein